MRDPNVTATPRFRRRGFARTGMTRRFREGITQTGTSDPSGANGEVLARLISARSEGVLRWRNWHRTCQSKRRMSSDADADVRSERSFLIDDAARLLGVSRRTVYYRIREGRLLTIRARCGSQRVLLSSIEALRRHQEGRQEGCQEGRREGEPASEGEVADVMRRAGASAGELETKALPL